ncbi:MAG: hypothetical protein RLZZ383_2197, partial [Pseudomonadota bacterium]
MCGIVAYLGPRNALPILVEGLRRLEYRGYDSAGVALRTPDGLWVRKKAGRVDDLAQLLQQPPTTNAGIAHTRWATHGGVTDANAHPHLNGAADIAVVHNGIIENMSALKSALEADGVVFASETDTEVLPHLLAKVYAGDPVDAVRRTLAAVRGTYGVAVLFR